jgi:cytosine/adenosine deaminase-related metal-dependent hydrolase
MQARTALGVRGLVGVACLSATSALASAPTGPADLLLVNGRVYTLAWDEPAGGWHPEGRMSPEEAVREYTTWNAYAAGWDKEAGVIAPGRWADVTVMSVDPLVVGASDPGRLLRGSILATIVSGKVVYAADALRKTGGK